jgi:hypothetical protein
MSDELVKRLRDKWQHSEELCYSAADRINELTTLLMHADAKLALTNRPRRFPMPRSGTEQD